MKPVNTILYIDDDTDDLQMLTDAFESINSHYHIMHAGNGEEGLAKLYSLKEQEELPCLIVLDVNMPKLDGKETFKRIIADERLAKIPVVIFSTSNNPVDKNFFAHSNVEYITKPLNFSHFLEVARKLLNYCAN